jgi:hypothetical protein
MPTQSLESEVKDSVARINDEVAVGEDLQFQERWWRFERVVWIFFALILLCTFLGLFGRGPLASAKLSNDKMEVRFDRIGRTGTPSLMEVTFTPAAIHDGKVRLYVSETVVRELGAQRIIPSPAETTIGNGGLTYTFPASGTPAFVKFGLQPDGPGIYRMKIGIAGEQPLESRVIVMP